jgi:hypothetical protein
MMAMAGRAPSAAAASAAAPTFAARSLDVPDERRLFVAHGGVDVVLLGDATIGRATFEPGWRWSVDVRPIAGTSSCQVPHVGYVLAGRMRIELDDGRAAEIEAGDGFVCPPGHDAWTLGEEACVLIDLAGMASYARGS